MTVLPLATLSPFQIALLAGVALAFVSIVPILGLALYALIQTVVRGVRTGRRSDEENPAKTLS